MKTDRQLINAIIPHILRAVVVIGMATMITFTVGKAITKISTTLNEKKVMTFAMQKRSETTQELQTAFATIGESEKKIRDAFPITENVLEFVIATEAIGNQNSMPQTIRFSPPGTAIVETPSLTIIPLTYTITTSGTATTLLNYLRQFESLSYFAGIRSITVTTGAPQGWNGASTMTIQGTLYTKKSL